MDLYMQGQNKRCSPNIYPKRVPTETLCKGELLLNWQVLGRDTGYRHFRNKQVLLFTNVTSAKNILYYHILLQNQGFDH